MANSHLPIYREGIVPQKIHSRRPEQSGQAMVKWCGKSAPRSWRQFRQGKPHRLKDQAAGARPGHYRRVGRLSQLVTVGLDKWLSKTKLGLQTRSFDFYCGKIKKYEKIKIAESVA